MARQLPSKTANVSQTKAKQILSDGTVRGNPLTTKQKGMFGAIAGGGGKKASKAPPRKQARKPPGGRPQIGAPGIGGLAIGQRRRGGPGMPPPLA